MKKNFITLAVFATMFIAKSNYAQLMAGTNIRFNHENLLASSKMMVAAESDKAMLANIKSLSPRMFYNFTNSFPDATAIVVVHQKQFTEITCKTPGATNRLSYNKKGKLEQSIRYLRSSMLPANIVAQVKEAYPDYSVSQFAVEVTVGLKTAYLVTIENCTKWKKIKVVDNEMEESESFQKG